MLQPLINVLLLTTMERYAVIVAGGKGLRMGSERPKQFLCIGGKPILMHTLEAFYRYDATIHLVLVLPHSHQPLWAELCEEHHFTLPYKLVDGGETRFHSVKNGLSAIPNQGVVAIHDGVRPFLHSNMLDRCFQAVEIQRAVIPVINVVDTVRQLTPDGSQTVDRNAYKLVQTPQLFKTSLLKQAYEQPYTTAFTDDASVVEAMGEKVALVAGSRENIKITTPFDMKVAEALIGNFIHS